MTKFTKVVKKAVADLISTTVSQKAEEAPEKKDEPTKETEKVAEEERKVVKMESFYEVACPHCSKKFGVEYDPTYKNAEYPKDYVEEKEPEAEKKAEVIDEPHSEPDKDDEKKAEYPEHYVEEKETEKKAEVAPVAKKATLPTPTEWKEAAFGIKPSNKVNAFHQAVEQSFQGILKQ